MNSDKIHRLIYKGATKLGQSPCDECNSEKSRHHILRTHFHASNVGECNRKVYYNLYNTKNKIESGLTNLFLFAGHLFEALIVQCLELAREEVHTISSNDGSDLTVNIKRDVTVDGGNIQVHIIGHYDVVINNEILLEIKSVKTNSFKDVFLKGDLSQRQQYYGQVQAYMEAMPHIKKAYLIGIHRESCEIAPPIEIKRDPVFMNRIFKYYADILHYGIIKNQLPPRSHENLNDYECRFCDYYQPCKDNKKTTEKDK